MTNQLWGIDLGGTKIEGVILSPDSLITPLHRERIETEAEGGYDHILSQIKSLVSTLSQQSNCKPRIIGLGTPGSLDPQSETLKNSNTICLNGRRLQADLENVLGCKTLLANDANCFALAEATLGIAQGVSTVFGVIMGTGVGGGIVVNKKVVSGHHGIAGEWGHNPLLPEGPQCYCGKRGCVETILSGPALETFYESRSRTHRPLAEIALRARDGSDLAARDTIARLTENFGRAISMVVNILDPDIIVLGGGVSNIDELPHEGSIALERYIFNTGVSCRIVKHSLGDSAGVFGAAMLTAQQD